MLYKVIGFRSGKFPGKIAQMSLESDLMLEVKLNRKRKTGFKTLMSKTTYSFHFDSDDD